MSARVPEGHRSAGWRHQSRMTAEEFVDELESANRAALAAHGAASAAEPPADPPSIVRLLELALRNELEAAELAARWMADTPELDARLALARQCGDEARHYRLIEERLRDLGRDPAGLDPSAQGPTPLLAYLRTLETTVERAAAGQFTREAIAVVRNDVFAAYCEERGDAATAALYRDRIQPDERHHHELGRRLLLRYATTEEAQGRARAAAGATLRIADELMELARMKAGLCRLPGC